MPDSKKIHSELNILDKKYRDQEYLLTVGVESKELEAKNYRDFWLKSIGDSLYEKFIKSPDDSNTGTLIVDEAYIDYANETNALLQLSFTSQRTVNNTVIPGFFGNKNSSLDIPQYLVDSHLLLLLLLVQVLMLMLYLGLTTHHHYPRTPYPPIPLTHTSR
jgi:hypothetical protein